MSKKAIITSLGIGLLLTLAVYLLSNLSFPVSSENHTLKWAYQLTRGWRDTNRPIPADMLLINTSYDRRLVDIYDDYGFEKGNIDITDRAKLVDLLRRLNDAANYRYIIMDIRFEPGMETPDDSLLWDLIARTPRLVIPRHANIPSVDDRLEEKSAMADFYASIDEGDFSKYVVAPDEKESVALKVYQDLTCTKYSRLGWFYFSEGRPMKRAMLLNLDVNPETETDADGYTKVYNLGADILADDTPELFADRMIFIGNFFESDLHPTYKGSMAGVAIHANAVKDLFAKKHLISWWTLIALWLTLSTIIFSIIYPYALKQKLNPAYYIPDKVKNNKHLTPLKPVLQIGWSFLGYSALMTAIFLLIYLITGQIYEIIFVSIVLTVISLFYKQKAK